MMLQSIEANHAYQEQTQPFVSDLDYTMVMSRTILVVDDKANVRILLREYLTEQGFRVVTAENGRIALFTARREKPDLILLDIMMPEMDGTEFIRIYRKESDTPIILLTAKPNESDKVISLELGADDYVTKPFSPQELVSRVRAVLRRMQRSDQPSGERPLVYGDLRIDRRRREVRVLDESGEVLDEFGGLESSLRRSADEALDTLSAPAAQAATCRRART